MILTMVEFSNSYFAQMYPLMKLSEEANLPDNISKICEDVGGHYRSVYDDLEDADLCQTYSDVLSKCGDINNVGFLIQTILSCVTFLVG